MTDKTATTLLVATPESTVPDWQQADPSYINKALRHALENEAGGWYVVGGSLAIPRERALGLTIEGRELVVFRDEAGAVQVAPGACPHLGAKLCDGPVRDGHVICPWHGLALGRAGHRGWKPYPVFDDGALVWVRLRGDALAPPPLPRPSTPFICAVIRVEAVCEPDDVIANRLDPWHGAYFHPHSFGKLRVLEQTLASITVRVTYRILGSIGVEVDATFHAPTSRCIVMTIIRGQGAGSLVETHATPIGPGRTAVVEATFATSADPGFRYAMKLARWIRPLIAKRARRLWVEDAAYAERRFALRTKSPALLPP